MRVTTQRRRQQGDTIIEVMFAVAVFAMVAVGSLAIMNQGTATAQRSLEVTLVRQQIQAQAEALRYIHDAYVASYQPGSQTVAGTTAAEWTKILTDYNADKISDFDSVANGSTCQLTSQAEKPFIVNARSARVVGDRVAMQPTDGSLPPFAQIIYDGNTATILHDYGLWIEALPVKPADSVAYIDFHIRACWNSPGVNRPMTLGTIVRLYDPTQ